MRLSRHTRHTSTQNATTENSQTRDSKDNCRRIVVRKRSEIGRILVDEKPCLARRSTKTDRREQWLISSNEISDFA